MTEVRCESKAAVKAYCTMDCTKRYALCPFLHKFRNQRTTLREQTQNDNNNNNNTNSINSRRLCNITTQKNVVNTIRQLQCIKLIKVNWCVHIHSYHVHTLYCNSTSHSDLLTNIFSLRHISPIKIKTQKVYQLLEVTYCEAWLGH